MLSGNEAVALAAWDYGIALGTGYPGTPSTEILEHLSAFGGRAQWAPNEKVALEVGLGVAMAGAAALVTMKHVGLNVAADPLFTAAYTGTSGPLVIVSADDPGMASSQNEQDNRRFAVAAARADARAGRRPGVVRFHAAGVGIVRPLALALHLANHHPRLSLEDRGLPSVAAAECRGAAFRARHSRGE